MKEKLNNALNDIDERLIQEAAEANRLESSAPKIMRRILIPTGVVAAAGLCVFGLSSLPNGGVSLTQSSAASDISAAELIEIIPETVQQTTEVSEEQTSESITDNYSPNDNSSRITQTITDYYQQNGITSDPDRVFELVDSMIYPLDSSYRTITTYNGYDQWHGGNHYGIDISDAGISGSLVYSPLSGTVIKANGDNGWNDGIGNYIIIDHGSGLSTVYGHLGEVNVTSGQSVTQGEIIGTVGSSGFSTGAHLHFEIREDGEVSNEAIGLFTSKILSAVRVDVRFEDSYHSFGLSVMGTDELSEFTQGTFTVDGNMIYCVFGNGHTKYGFYTTDEELLNADTITAVADNGTEQAEVTFTRQDLAVTTITQSIYDSENAPQLINSLTCPVAEEHNVVTETPGNYYGHTGIDFQTDDIFGQDIYAAQSGKVVLAQWYYGYGYCIMIDHGSGVLTVYGHCNELNVSADQRVQQGDVIGKVGKTGQTSSGHLHFEIRVNDTPAIDVMNEFIERIGSVRSNTTSNVQ